MSGPRKTTKAPAEGAAPDELTEAAATIAAVPAAAAAELVAPVAAAAPPAVAASEAAVPPPVVATAAPPVAAAAPPVAAAAPPPPAPAAPPAAAAAPAGPPPGAQVAAAISGLASGIKERLSTAELLLGAGALLILGLSYLLLEFLAGSFGPSETAVIVSVLLLVLIGLERTEREGFGTWYRVLLILMGAILAIGAAYSLLFTLRHSAGMDFVDWLSALAWWIGGGLAGAGAWLTYKVRA